MGDRLDDKNLIPKGRRSKTNTDIKKHLGAVTTYLAALIIGFYLSGASGLVLGPLIRSKKKNWFLWILILLPLQLPFIFLANLSGIDPRLFMSPKMMSKYY